MSVSSSSSQSSKNRTNYPSSITVNIRDRHPDELTVASSLFGLSQGSKRSLSKEEMDNIVRLRAREAPERVTELLKQVENSTGLITLDEAIRSIQIPHLPLEHRVIPSGRGGSHYSTPGKTAYRELIVALTPIYQRLPEGRNRRDFANILTDRFQGQHWKISIKEKGEKEANIYPISEKISKTRKVIFDALRTQKAKPIRRRDFSVAPPDSKPPANPKKRDDYDPGTSGTGTGISTC